MKANKRLKAGKLSVGMISQRDEAVLNSSGQRVESVLYSFASDGGAIGTVSFGRKLPAGAIVVSVLTDEISAVAGATAVTINAGATALTAALDLTATAGIQNRALAGAVAGIKLAVDSELNMSIATAPASSGSMRIFVEYRLPNDLAL